MSNTPPPYSVSPATPTSDYSSRPSSSLSELDLPDIDVSSDPGDQDLPPSIDGYVPQQPEELPEYPRRPRQLVFMSLDVLNSVVVDALTGESVMESCTSPEEHEEEETLVRSLSGEDGPTTVCRIVWPSARKAKSGPSLDFGQGTFLLRKWMARTGMPGTHLRIRHRGRMYDVYTAGQALGVRYTPSSKRTNTRHPMLLGIRDPHKHTELLLSPQIAHDARVTAEVLEIGCLLTVLLKSKRELGADFDERRVKDRIWAGVAKTFSSIGNAQRGQILMAEVSRPRR